MSAYTSFTIEDYVTQVGQGAIRGRSKEHLAASETRVVLLRQLWFREVNALVDGQALTDWKMPPEPLALGQQE
jgi:5,5'-dehydrodivanillate O-demethylase